MLPVSHCCAADSLDVCVLPLCSLPPISQPALVSLPAPQLWGWVGGGGGGGDFQKGGGLIWSLHTELVILSQQRNLGHFEIDTKKVY
jgi:hypothetical protein